MRSNLQSRTMNITLDQIQNLKTKEAEQMLRYSRNLLRRIRRRKRNEVNNENNRSQS